MKGAILLALVAPTLAFVPVKPVVPMAKTQSRSRAQTIMQMDPSVMPGLASTPGQPTVESWLMDNADKKLCKYRERKGRGSIKWHILSLTTPTHQLIPTIFIFLPSLPSKQPRP